jgi:hypothetical protein
MPTKDGEAMTAVDDGTRSVAGHGVHGAGGSLPGLLGHDIGRELLGGVAGAVEHGIAWTVSATMSWWVRVPSPDLAADPAVGTLQRLLLPVTIGVAILAVIAAAARMTLSRRPAPLAEVAIGIGIVAATSAVGVVLPSLLLRAGDAWSDWALDTSAGGQFGTRLTGLLSMSGAPSAVVVVLGIVAIVLAAIQAILMLFRQLALVVLAGVLPLAAAGTLTSATRPWFRHVTGWMLALIFYKPAAAAVYASAFTVIGTGRGPRTVLTGFAMLLLSLVALPALIKLFTWPAGAISSTGGNGLLSTILGGAVAVGAMRGASAGAGGGSAASQAQFLASQLGPAPSGSGAAHGPARESSPADQSAGGGARPGMPVGAVGSTMATGAAAQAATAAADISAATARHLADATRPDEERT